MHTAHTTQCYTHYTRHTLHTHNTPPAHTCIFKNNFIKEWLRRRGTSDMFAKSPLETSVAGQAGVRAPPGPTDDTHCWPLAPWPFAGQARNHQTQTISRRCPDCRSAGALPPAWAFLPASPSAPRWQSGAEWPAPSPDTGCWLSPRSQHPQQQMETRTEMRAPWGATAVPDEEQRVHGPRRGGQGAAGPCGCAEGHSGPAGSRLRQQPALPNQDSWGDGFPP